MRLIVRQGEQVRRLVLCLLLGGVLAGILGPSLSSWLGAAASPALLALLLSLGGWLARGIRFPLGGRLLLALSSGALLGWLEAHLQTGLPPALLGLALGISLSLQPLGGDPRAAFLQALPTACGASLGALLGGFAGISPWWGALGIHAQSAFLAGSLGLGVALGELSRELIWASPHPPRWILEQMRSARPRGGILLREAVDARHRAITTLIAAQRLDPWDQEEALRLSDELLLASAQAVAEAEEATASLGGLAPAEESLEELQELYAAQARQRESLTLSAAQAWTEAGRLAALLGLLALSLSERNTLLSKRGLPGPAQRLPLGQVASSSPDPAERHPPAAPGPEAPLKERADALRRRLVLIS